MKKILALLIVFFLFPTPAFADTVPPDQAPGANIIPGNETTNIQLLREYVYLVVKAKTPGGSLGQTNVDAIYILYNHGFTDEYMSLYLPLTSLEGGNNSSATTPEIKDTSVIVNQLKAAVQRVMRNGGGQTNTPYAEFKAVFPARKDTTIEVKYTLEGMGVYPYVSYKYILTEAGWYKGVDRVVVRVTLPYDSNNQNIIQGENIGWLNTTSFGYLQDQGIIWAYQNPIFDHGSNFQVSLVMPSVWQTVLKERGNVTQNPDDGKAWERLAQVYKDITLLPQGIRTDPGGQELYRLGLEAYQRAIALLPNDADTYSDYADLLYNHYYWTQASGFQPDRSELSLLLKALKRALEINPNNEKAGAVLQEMQNNLPGAVEVQGGAYNFLWLTATPTINASLMTQAPTATTTLTPTAEASATSQPTGPLIQNTPKYAPPFCGSIALIPVLLAGFVWLRRRQLHN